MAFSTIDFSIAAGVATIRINRPKKLNAMNRTMIQELEQSLIDCESRADISVLVLIGNENAFIAGADIGPMAGGDVNVGRDVADATYKMQERLADIGIPTIAALSGYALGGGLELALCCDIRIAAENAVLGLPEITLGIIPGGGGTQRLPRLVGPARATPLLFLGERIDAQKALSIGLVTEVYPNERLEAEAQQLAQKLSRMPSVALSACKRAMRSGLNTGLKEGLRIEQVAFSMLFGTHDQKEGMAAFLEKRKPKFEGR